MAQDTLLRSQLATQPERLQASSQGFQAAQYLGSSLGQAARNFVDVQMAQEQLAQRGAEGRMRMLTEQMRQEELQAKIGLIDQGTQLAMQQENLRILRARADAIEQQNEVSPDEQFSREMMSRYLNVPIDMGDGTYKLATADGMVDIAPARVRAMLQQAGGGGGEAGMGPGERSASIMKPFPGNVVDGQQLWNIRIPTDDGGTRILRDQSPDVIDRMVSFSGATQVKEPTPFEKVESLAKLLEGAPSREVRERLEGLLEEEMLKIRGEAPTLDDVLQALPQDWLTQVTPLADEYGPDAVFQAISNWILDRHLAGERPDEIATQMSAEGFLESLREILEGR